MSPKKHKTQKKWTHNGTKKISNKRSRVKHQTEKAAMSDQESKMTEEQNIKERESSRLATTKRRVMMERKRSYTRSKKGNG